MSRILLVEDDDLYRSLLGQALLLREYEVIMAINAQEAIAISQEALPDLILMDARLPLTSGFEAIASIKENPNTEGIPVIILSAVATMRDREKGVALGCDAYLLKPFSFRELFKVIDTSLGNKPTPIA